MIEAFSVATAHHFQDALASQARLRYEVFVKRRKLDHSSWEGLEFDEFDTPAATYLIWRDEQRAVRGLARLLRTTGPYMLRSYWPHLVEERELPSSPLIFEVTRVCVDKRVEPLVRRTIFPKLLCAIQEFMYRNGGIGMIGVTREHLLAHFIQTGIQWLGSAHLVEGEMERAFFVPTPNIRPAWHCRKFDIAHNVLASEPDTSAERHAA
jgi:acyl homoserine lactone synthase